MAAERERLERLASQLDALLRDSSAAEPSPSELAALDADLSNKFPSVRSSFLCIAPFLRVAYLNYLMQRI